MRTATAPLERGPATYHKLRLENSNTYLIKGKAGYVMVDAGNNKNEAKFARFLKRREILPSDIRLIIITHAHYDHTRTLRAIKELCNCPVAIHENESDLLRRGTVAVPPGTYLTGKITSALAARLRRFVTLTPVDPEITISNDISLAEFGIDGWMVTTPGHTSGSISVLLSSGEAFVGDLAVNYSPFAIGNIFPPFASDVRQLLKSWEKLLDAGASMFLPAHGRPFTVQVLQRKLHQMRSKYMDRI